MPATCPHLPCGNNTVKEASYIHLFFEGFKTPQYFLHKKEMPFT